MEAKRASARAELPGDLKLLDADDGEFAFFLWRGLVVIQAWPHQATAHSVARLKEVTMTLNRDRPPGSCGVHLVAAGAALPTAEARAGFIDLMQNFTGAEECVSIVLGSGGFWASALRSVVLGMRMVVPRAFPLLFHHDLLSSARWLAKESKARGGVPFKPEDLVRAMDDARRYANVVMEPQTLDSKQR